MGACRPIWEDTVAMHCDFSSGVVAPSPIVPESTTNRDRMSQAKPALDEASSDAGLPGYAASA